MAFAPTFVSAIVLILSNVLTYIGIEIGSEALTTTLNTLITVGVGLFVMFRQVKTGRSTVAGTRPK